MGKKHKVAQAARREARKMITPHIKEQFTFLNSIIKPKPRYVPTRMWQRMAKWFIDTEKLKEYVNKKG